MDFSFLRENIQPYWNRAAIKIDVESALVEKFPDLNQFLSYFSHHFKDNFWQEVISVPANASKIGDDGTVQQYMNVDLHFARELYSQGFSICFADLSSEIHQIKLIKGMAADVFGYSQSIIVTAYLSPPNSTGVLHFDRQHNVFIQRSGVKRWFVSNKPGLANPHDNLVYTGITKSKIESLEASGASIEIPSDCGVSRHTLEPGEALYVPPGFYHSPETLNQPSLHYTLTFEPVCFWKDFQNRLDYLLEGPDRELFQDYRMLDDNAKSELFERCFRLLKSRVLL